MTFISNLITGIKMPLRVAALDGRMSSVTIDWTQLLIPTWSFYGYEYNWFPFLSLQSLP